MKSDIRSGGVFCDICDKCICQPRKRKNFQRTSYITCDDCENGKFSSQKFSLQHLGNNIWVIKNDDNQVWCGDDQWVSMNSSYMATTPNCFARTFDFNEVIDFIKNHFETNLG